jgi:hypothetical protein
MTSNDTNEYTIDTLDLSDSNYNFTIDTMAGFNGTYTTATTPYTFNNGGSLSITGENADIEMNGKSMKAWMNKVEERLAILEPNEKLEAEWAELKELGERYRAMEQELIEKAKVWGILKD